MKSFDVNAENLFKTRKDVKQLNFISILMLVYRFFSNIYIYIYIYMKAFG